jgi:hypothetical protein
MTIITLLLFVEEFTVCTVTAQKASAQAGQAVRAV